MARTRLTNNTGQTRTFGYIPPHGQSLASGAAVLIEGDLRSVLAGGRNRYSRRRELTALDADIASGAVLVEAAADPSSSSSSSS